MKKLNSLQFATTAILILFAFLMSSCSAGIAIGPSKTHPTAKRLPPGQAKKIYGGKSAKRYAPGHNKNS